MLGSVTDLGVSCPKIRGTLFWGSLKYGSYYLGYYIRVPIFGNSHLGLADLELLSGIYESMRVLYG